MRKISLVLISFLISFASKAELETVPVRYSPSESIESEGAESENKENAHVGPEERWNDFLPIWGKEAAALGHTLPLPMGVTVLYQQSNQSFNITDATIGLNNICIPNPLPFGKPCIGGEFDQTIENGFFEFDTVTGKDDTVLVKLDTWIFPFLNVYAIGGYTEGYKDITIKGILGNPVEDIKFRQKYKGSSFGVGSVLAGQIGPVVLVSNFTFTRATVDITDTTIDVFVGTLHAGHRFDLPKGQKLTLLAGYMVQNIKQTDKGKAKIGDFIPGIGGEVEFNVTYESQKTHNMTLMAQYELNKHWAVIAEYGFLNWTHIITGLNYRF